MEIVISEKDGYAAYEIVNRLIALSLVNLNTSLTVAHEFCPITSAEISFLSVLLDTHIHSFDKNSSFCQVRGEV